MAVDPLAHADFGPELASTLARFAPQEGIFNVMDREESGSLSHEVSHDSHAVESTYFFGFTGSHSVKILRCPQWVTQCLFRRNEGGKMWKEPGKPMWRLLCALGYRCRPLGEMGKYGERKFSRRADPYLWRVWNSRISYGME